MELLCRSSDVPAYHSVAQTILTTNKKEKKDMFEITYTGVFIFITLAWIVTRVICGIRNKKVDWKYEAKLLTVYICLVVIA